MRSTSNRYENAGANCFFVPFLSDLGLISQLCDRVNLLVNIMLRDLGAELAPLRDAGLSQISYGPTPYRAAYGAISQSAEPVLALLE
jgi:2-methylisocitrate lyase-like PEP mutase family enzyme